MEKGIGGFLKTEAYFCCVLWNNVGSFVLLTEKYLLHYLINNHYKAMRN
jgi:hypothetical protein